MARTKNQNNISKIMEAKDFLEKNGFEIDSSGYEIMNNNCSVRIVHGEYYRIKVFKSELNEVGNLYSRDLNIYWLIGVLTYYGLIDKNYIQ